jgi:hypothetical protein
MQLFLLSSESVKLVRMHMSANRTLEMALAARLRIERELLSVVRPRNYRESITLPGWEKAISGII